MLSPTTTVASLSLLFLLLPLRCSHAWKPIVGPASAEHVYTSSSFSVKQSHPDYGSKSFSSANLRHAKPIHVAHTGLEAVVNDDSTTAVTPSALKGIHISYEDEFDDFESINSGYGSSEARFLHDHQHQQVFKKLHAICF